MLALSLLGRLEKEEYAAEADPYYLGFNVGASVQLIIFKVIVSYGENFLLLNIIFGSGQLRKWMDHVTIY